MEWFDFGVYAYTTAYIERTSSPVESADIRQMLTFAALAIAFLLRPIVVLYLVLLVTNMDVKLY